MQAALKAKPPEDPRGRRRRGAVAPETAAWASRTWCAVAPGANLCLVQALVAQRLLLADGHAPRLHLGAKRHRDEPFGAHAWLELDGSVIIGDNGELDDYRPFAAGGAP